jgi:uncharacterized LabA/DUF88 family protein
MPHRNQNKIAVFIDGASLYSTAKTLGFGIDYKRLLTEIPSRGTLLRAFYYTRPLMIRNTRRSARSSTGLITTASPS